jgi:hypothetical protein
MKLLMRGLFDAPYQVLLLNFERGDRDHYAEF